MKKRNLLIGTSAFAGLALALTGCVPSGGTTEAGSEELTLSMQFTPASNWALETFDANILNQIGCGETLLKFNNETNELEPMLATEWSQADPTTWEFTLRDGVTFQDGTELTAETAAAALQHLLEVSTPSPAFGPDNVTGIEATGDYTLQITTPEESALLPLRVASVNSAILAPAAYEGSQIDIKGTCTGPFQVTDEVATQSVTLEAYDGYWGDAPSIKKVEARFFPEASTRATQIRTGESQIGLAVPISSLGDLEGDDNVTVTRSVIPRTTGLYFNTAKAPFDNPDVRRAIQLALDTQLITDSVFDGVATPASSVFGTDYAWAPEGATVVKQNLDEAKALLEGAGIAEGSLTVGLVAYTERGEFSDLAAVIQAELAEIGVNVEIQSGDYASLEPALLGGDFDMSLLSRNQLVNIADPAAYLQADYTCDGTYNISQYCDAEMDSLINAAVSTIDPEARYAAYAEIAAKIQDEAITVAIVNEEQLAATVSNLEGFFDDPLNRYAVTTDLAFK